MALSRSMKNFMMARNKPKAVSPEPSQKPTPGTFNRVFDQGSSPQPTQGVSGMVGRLRNKESGAGKSGITGMIRGLMDRGGESKTGGSFGGMKPRPSFDGAPAGDNTGRRYAPPARPKAGATRGKPTPNIRARQVGGVQGSTRPQGAQRAFGGSRRFLR